MSHITTHVLDLARGRPAAGVAVRLEQAARDTWQTLATASTDADGRVAELGPAALEPGTYRLRFDTGAYQAAQGETGGGFYPEVTITFRVEAGQDHYHVPLLLSPWGYSTYRGS